MGIEKEIELHIPSTLGYEKVAMEAAASVAKKMGFTDDRIEDLKTAIAEACCNAIEHGNKLDETTKVGVTLTVKDSQLHVAVHDQGKDIGQVDAPDIDNKIEGKEALRGMGMFIIENLMNEVRFESHPDGGKTVKMVVYLEQ